MLLHFSSIVATGKLKLNPDDVKSSRIRKVSISGVMNAQRVFPVERHLPGDRKD